MSAVASIESKLAELHIATRAADADRARLALAAATAVDPAPLERQLQAVEGELARYSTQRQRLEAALQEAQRAQVVETEDSLKQRLETARKVVLDRAAARVELAADLQATLDRLAEQIAKLTTLGTEAREALASAARALAALAPEAAGTMRNASASIGHFARGDALRDPTAARLAAVLASLGVQHDLPVHQNNDPLQDAAQADFDALANRLAGWDVETVRAAHEPIEIEQEA